MSADERIERARLLYERAVFGGDSGALDLADQGLDSVEADLALARGRVIHARFLARRDGPDESREEWDATPELALFERAALLYGREGDRRGEAEAIFWIGTFHQVVQHDDSTAVPFLQRSLELAERAGDELTMSYALRHLGIAEHTAGHLSKARARLEESVRLRRGIGFMSGVAANLIGLAYIAVGEGRRDDALAIIDEAGAIAAASGADAILRSVEEARSQL